MRAPRPPRARPLALALYAAGVLLALAPAPAEAQLPIWPFRRKRPPAPAVEVQPPPPPQPAVAAPATPPFPPLGLSPPQHDEKQSLLRDARARELMREVTVDNAKDRLLAWGMVRAIDPADPEALRGHERARQDLELAQKQADAEKARQHQAETQQAVRAQVKEASGAYRSGDLARAAPLVDEALQLNPQDPQALSLRAAIDRARELQRLRRMLLYGSGGLLLGGGGLGYLVWRALKRRRERGEQQQNARRALLQVVDGVGRGKLVAIEGEVLRIGAADGEAPEEKNDLVLSDSAALISRYHCTVIRKEGDFFLIDSSLNGTALNREPLARGETRRLEDGDVFTLAAASRVKFVRT